MSPQLRTAFLSEIGLEANKLTPAAWAALERAHVLSQAYAISHLLVHWRMLRFALLTQQWREFMGQVARLLLAAPGSLLGKAPVGNTGGANVGIFLPMTIPADLRSILLTDERSREFMGDSEAS